MRLIGITARADSGGTARVGKDKAAELLQTEGYARLAFADPLYAAVQVLLGLTDAEMHQYTLHKDFRIPRWGKSLREVLQDLGDWAQQTFGENVFVQTLSRELDHHSGLNWTRDGMRGAVGYVVPDVRLEHEAAWIRDNGGVVIHLEGPARSDVPQSGCEHKTEAGIRFVPGRDVLVRNDGTETELLLKLRGVLLAVGDAA